MTSFNSALQRVENLERAFHSGLQIEILAKGYFPDPVQSRIQSFSDNTILIHAFANRMD